MLQAVAMRAVVQFAVFILSCTTVHCFLLAKNLPFPDNILKVNSACSRQLTRCLPFHKLLATSAATSERTEKDPFLKIINRMPKESYDLLVSNVDPSTVNAVDLVRHYFPEKHVLIELGTLTREQKPAEIICP